MSKKRKDVTPDALNVVPPEQREIFAVMKPTENGHEVKVTSRDTFQRIGNDGKPYVSLVTDEQEGDVSITFNKSKVQQLVKESKMDAEFGATLIKMFDDQEELLKLAKSQNSHINTTSNDAMMAKILQQNDEIPKRLSAMRHLISIRDSIHEQGNADAILFKKHVDPKKSFGITKALMDRIPYLIDLLDKANLNVPKNKADKYIVTSKIDEHGIGTIGLEHTLQLGNHKTPEEAYLSFIEDMRGDALKVFLAYWAHANKVGSFSYLSKLTDVMAATLDESRKSCVSVKEKRRFWQLSKLLESTKLTITIKIGNEYITIKCPLLDVSVTSCNKRDQETKDGYPTKVHPRVLDPNVFKSNATLATEISKGTPKLPAQDVMLALTLQARESQRRNHEDAKLDEEYLIKQSGLIPTYNANPRVGKQRLKQKLKRLQEADASGRYTKTENIYKFDTNNARKHQNKK